jgi:hypothetical protein
MAATNEILKTRYARFDKCFLNVATDVARWRAVKWQIAALGANDNFIAREAVFVC